MHIAVLIVGYKNAPDILRCVDALSFSTHLDFEIVVCENGGHDAAEYLQLNTRPRLPGGQSLRVIESSHNGGYASGINICLRASPKADAWWVLNPDTEPFPEAMATLAQKLQTKGYDAAGGVLFYPTGQVQSCGGIWHAWTGRSIAIGFGERLELIDERAVERAQNYLSGASMMIGRRFLSVVGHMREDYFLYGEELEWCLRARSRGLRLGFAGGAHVVHHEGTTTGNVANMGKRIRLPVYLAERNRLLLTRDVFPLRLPIVSIATLFLIFFRYVMRGAWQQAGFAYAGWWAGLRNERGIPAL